MAVPSQFWATLFSVALAACWGRQVHPLRVQNRDPLEPLSSHGCNLEEQWPPRLEEASLKTHPTCFCFVPGHVGQKWSALGAPPSPFRAWLWWSPSGNFEDTVFLFSCFVLAVSWLLFQTNLERAGASITAGFLLSHYCLPYLTGSPLFCTSEISWGHLFSGERQGDIGVPMPAQEYWNHKRISWTEKRPLRLQGGSGGWKRQRLFGPGHCDKEFYI